MWFQSYRPLQLRRMAAGVIMVAALWLAASSRATGLPPEEARRALTPASGFEIQLSASEPMIRQPVNIMFDERGRLWVVQYIQYPYPAGLKIISQDQFLRTKYDRVPEPPPRGPRGADRITILQSSKSDGKFDKSVDFVTGLNLATAMEIGYGGVWVAQTPYLLFYPMKEGSDAPAGEPQVILSGFGMEDAHAVVNHLTWGPDGWLYGAQGSTNTAHIQGQEFQQAAWRYNPRTKAFEVFSEGGGNTFGLEWDEHGNLLTGTNFGGSAMVHYVQGGYFIKNFGKHGELHNPYAFGFFGHVPHEGWHGGHVTQNGVIYQGGAFPSEFNGSWITPRLLDNKVDWDTVKPAGSSFTTRYAGDLITSTDRRFRPVDIRTGPDGAVYVADWYDIRANHVIAKDDWEKDTGRVYRIAPTGLPFYQPIDLGKLSSDQLVDQLDKSNDWYARTARRLLADRRDPAVVPRLRKMVGQNRGRLALQSLWALYVSGGFDDAFAESALAHENPDVRAWTVRLLCDEKHVSEKIEAKLVALAEIEKSPVVRMQLACSARRLPAEQDIPIVEKLLRHSEDVQDRYIPLLLWWAIEDKAISGQDLVLKLWKNQSIWSQPLARDFLLERLARRYAAERSADGFSACAALLTLSPGQAENDLIISGIDLGLRGAPLPAMPDALKESAGKLWTTQKHTPLLIRLMLRLGLRQAQADAIELASGKDNSPANRVSMIELLAQTGDASCEPHLLALLDAREPKEVRRAAIAALQRFDDPGVPGAVLKEYPRMDRALRGGVISLLAGRAAWAAALLDAIGAGAVQRTEVSLDQVRQIALHGDAKLDARVTRLWGSVQPSTSAEKTQSMERVMRALRHGKGDSAGGKALFDQTCAACHTLRGRGGNIGPNLTAYDRTDLNFLVPNIVDPSASIRPEYATYTLRTTDRRVLSGPLVESTPQAVTIEDGTTKVTVPRSQIASLDQSAISRMPEKLLDLMTDAQVRDLFAYIALQEEPATPKSK
ncbi:MAG TPA: PVC-type heme-binding CxxCH protein [Tepidisphaeraceae bacterium]|nr:PVC-type heme-binding CxxCH protein [Tepidisphaeraceae bacterium]